MLYLLLAIWMEHAQCLLIRSWSSWKTMKILHSIVAISKQLTEIASADQSSSCESEKSISCSMLPTSYTIQNLCQRKTSAAEVTTLLVNSAYEFYNHFWNPVTSLNIFNILSLILLLYTFLLRFVLTKKQKPINITHPSASFKVIFC